jgi:hypothetical protein
MAAEGSGAGTEELRLVLVDADSAGYMLVLSRAPTPEERTGLSARLRRIPGVTDTQFGRSAENQRYLYVTVPHDFATRRALEAFEP